MLIIGLLIMGY